VSRSRKLRTLTRKRQYLRQNSHDWSFEGADMSPQRVTYAKSVDRCGTTCASRATSPPMTKPQRVSVIIPHYRDLTRLGLCLTALERQSYPREAVEIVVADNNSPEGEADVARAIAGRARLVVVTEKGAGPARNGGVSAATGEILAFLDSDCVPEPDWIAAGVTGLERYDFIGGGIKVLVDDPLRMTPAEAFERVFAFNLKAYITRKGFTVTANMFCPRTVFEAVGGFRTGVSEDVEWSHRARAAGYRLGYVPRAVVGHPARRSWPDLVGKWRRVNAETYGLARQRGQRLRWALREAAQPALALAHTPKVLSSTELETVSQRMAALGVLYRVRLWRLADSLRLLIGRRRS
jgi:GT2 family glycosyltransferase